MAPLFFILAVVHKYSSTSPEYEHRKYTFSRRWRLDPWIRRSTYTLFAAFCNYPGFRFYGNVSQTLCSANAGTELAVQCVFIYSINLYIYYIWNMFNIIWNIIYRANKKKYRKVVVWCGHPFNYQIQFMDAF